jgi:hypothetical protein
MRSCCSFRRPAGIAAQPAQSPLRGQHAASLVHPINQQLIRLQPRYVAETWAAGRVWTVRRLIVLVGHRRSWLHCQCGSARPGGF